jgi:PAS domain S-box-containing protein
MKVRNPHGNRQFLAGGGEMGELTRAKDWSKTPVGEPENWPQSLRTTLGIVLNSKFPMFLWWGPELICFYNDAYRLSLGESGKHPDILGVRAEEAWPEIWEIIKPLIDQVLAGGESTWAEDQLIPIFRNGKLEDVYWTFSYSPVNDESNKIAGVLVTCTETTGKVNTFKSLEESNRRYFNNIMQAPVAMSIFRGKDHVVEIANELMLELMGKPAEEILYKPLFEGLSEAKGQGLEQLIDRVYSTGQKFTANERAINLPRKGKLVTVYVNFVCEALKESDGTVSGIIATATDVTEQVTSQKKLEASEKEFRQLADLLPAMVWTTDSHGSQTFASKRWKEFTGLDPYDESTFEKMAHPDDLASIIKTWTDCLLSGKVYKTQVRLKSKFGDYQWFSANGEPVRNEKGEIDKWIGTFVNIHEQKTTEESLTIALHRVEESEKRFRETVKQAPLGITILRGPKFVVEVANQTFLQIVDRQESEFVGNPLFDSLPELKEIVGPLLTGVQTSGIPFYATEISVTLHRYGKRELSYFNLVYHPLREEDNEIMGIIVVATDVTESVRAKHLLMESEKQFRDFVMQSPIPMTIFRGEEFVIEMANKVMYEKIWRRKEEEVAGKKLLDVFPELKDQKYPELLHEVLSTGKIHRENESVAFVQGDDGLKKFYLDFEYSPLYEADGLVSGIMVTVNDVTEKVEARRKVEESEKRFRNVADNAPVLIWMAGIDKLCTFFNTAWLDFRGRTMEQEIGVGWTEGVHPEDFSACFDTYSAAFDKREKFYMECRLKRNDGEYRWVSNRGVPRFTADGVFEGYIGACMDIHEQFIYQQKLKEEEEKLNIVIEASELGMWEFDLITGEVNYSDRYLEILGYKNRVDLTQQQILDRLHPDDLPIRDEAYKKAFMNGFLHYEMRLVREDTSIHWGEGKGKVFYDEEGTPIRMLGTLRDITDEKNHQQELLESEQKFRLLADSMPQYIWTSDTEGNLNYFNQSVYDFSGLTSEQIAEGGWLQIVHPDDRDENVKVWINSVKTGKDFLFEHRFRRHDGEYRWQLSRAVPKKDAAGTIQMWVGTSTDIQDQKTFAYDLEKQVRERTRELEQKNRELEKMNSELQSFTYISSHDLQEPLRKIQTFASRLLEKEEKNLSKSGKDYFFRMQEAAFRMQTLIEDLLAYSRTNTAEVVFQNTDLKEIIEEVKNELKETIVEKQAIIEVLETCEANIIPFQFRQLIINLVSNSLKFSRRESSPHIKIKCSVVEGQQPAIDLLSPEKKYCHLSISDNGIGFDPQYKNRIFEVFQRLHGKEEYKGTGIGLAIVKKIVENHRGIIIAQGEENNGATFDIYFPID